MRVKSKFFQTISPVQLVVLTLALVGLGFGIGVDTTGKAYVTGGTASTNFPTTNTLQWNINGDMPGATTTQNSPPTADAGPDQTVRLGATVQLDGSQSSDPDGDPLTFNWEIISKPPESNAVILDPNAVRPTLLVDVVGEYVVRLIVNDGMLDSEPDTVMISVAEDFISYGQTRAGRIDFPGEHDPYVFSGNAGDVVVIAASSNDGFNPVRAEVFDPSGEKIAETPNNGSVTVTLPQSGTYTILVRSSNPVAVGRSYGVSRACL